MDLEGLLLRINSGKDLQRSEVEEVAALFAWMHEDHRVAQRISLDEVYSMLLVLGRAQIAEHRPLLERYLNSKDPVTVSLVLEILCLDWGVTEEILERVLDFALGVSWDTEDDVRHTALKILGEYLQTNPTKGEKQRQVLQLLLSVFDDVDGGRRTRQAAYYALCRAATRPWEEIPSEYKLLDLQANSQDLDHTMLEQLRQRVKMD